MLLVMPLITTLRRYFLLPPTSAAHVFIASLFIADVIVGGWVHAWARGLTIAAVRRTG